MDETYDSASQRVDVHRSLHLPLLKRDSVPESVECVRVQLLCALLFDFFFFFFFFFAMFLLSMSLYLYKLFVLCLQGMLSDIVVLFLWLLLFSG